MVLNRHSRLLAYGVPSLLREGNSVFPSPQKAIFPNSNKTQIQMTKSQCVEVPLQIPLFIIIFLLFVRLVNATLI